MKLLPDGDGALLVRTDFGHQQVWDELRELIRGQVPEGLLTTLRLVDDIAYEDATAEQLLDLVPGGAGYPYIALADAATAQPAQRVQDRTLLIVDNYDEDDEEQGLTFRAVVSELASIDANLATANMDFAEFTDEVDEDGVYGRF